MTRKRQRQTRQTRTDLDTLGQTRTDRTDWDRPGQTRQTRTDLDRQTDVGTPRHISTVSPNRVRLDDEIKQGEYYRLCGGDSSLRSTVSEPVVTAGVREEEDQDLLNLNLDQTEEDSSRAENQRLERDYLQLFRV